jgi:ABC-type Fe3+ transport system substrate-binding protein
MYAAMAKKTLHPQAAQDLLKYFATPEAGDIYIQSNPYKLPAQRALINTRNNASLSPVFPRISYEHCMDNNMKLIPFELISRDDYLEQMNQLLNNRAPATTITQTISATQACLKNQLVDKTQLAVNCRSIQ